MDDAEVRKRVQILRIAEAILIEDGNTAFAKQCEQWEQQTHSPAPHTDAPIPPSPPTQAEIVAKALEFFHACEELSVQPTTEPAQSDGKPEMEVADTAPASTYDAVLDPVRKIFSSTVESVLPTLGAGASRDHVRGIGYV